MLRSSTLCLLLSYGFLSQGQFVQNVQAYHKNKAELKTLDKKLLSQMVAKLTHRKGPLTLRDICMLHHCIYKGINNAYAGKIRTVGVKINGMTPPAASHVRVLMNQLVGWLKNTREHPLKKSSNLHLKFVDIHPFRDGNGRTGRLLDAIILMRHGYPSPTFLPSERKNYCMGINKALRTGDRRLYEKIMLNAVLRSFKNLKGKF